MNELLHKYVTKQAPIDQKPRLVDVGCGAGTTLSELKHQFECIGIEADPALADQAKQAGVPIIRMSLPGNIPLEQHSFSAVTMLDVLEHIDDAKGALESIRPLLAPHGRIVINVPAHQWLWSPLDDVNEHQRRYTKQALNETVISAGFTPIMSRYWGSLALPMIYLQRRIWWKLSGMTEYQTYIPPQRVNQLFRQLLLQEWKSISSIPFGVSVILVAKA